MPVLRPIIKNAEAAICKNCAYFREPKSPQSILMGKCTKFGEKNIITGSIKFLFAQEIRADEDLCGKRGIYYNEKMSNN
uniref:Uncharacterized protein n=1 Tax=viral metagenome TaxID=1070528 RepID=A0A6C0B2Z8_9ZZZZ